MEKTVRKVRLRKGGDWIEAGDHIDQIVLQDDDSSPCMMSITFDHAIKAISKFIEEGENDGCRRQDRYN